MGKPGTRRLLDAVKKRRTKIRNKNIVNKILPPSISQSKLSKSGQSSSGAIKKSKSSSDNQGGSPITCLIQEKVCDKKLFRFLKFRIVYLIIFPVCYRTWNSVQN